MKKKVPAEDVQKILYLHQRQNRSVVNLAERFGIRVETVAAILETHAKHPIHVELCSHARGCPDTWRF